MADKKQQLHGANRSVNIAEALSARVKDPLWFLSRQWQTGEFEAENGGRLADLELKSQHFPVARLHRGKKTMDVKAAAPLEALVEAEIDTGGDAPAWQSEALEYRFALDTTGHRFSAEDYWGFAIDWYLFELEGSLDDAKAYPEQPQNFIPTQLSFRGAPDPRWWRMEEGEAFFDSPQEVEPNILSTLLPEFFYTDVKNWYVIPAPMPAGSVREVTSLKVTDSFGVTTALEPAMDEGWQLFTIDPKAGKGDGVSGAALFAPNVALDIVHNDVLEDVRFMRDEQANLVWAWEHCYTDEAGEKIFNGGVKEESADSSSGPSGQEIGYKFMSPVPANWIPYLPRQKNLTPSSGEIYLRRGRTDPQANRANPQHKSKVVSEANRLLEEEVPRTGLRVRRIEKFAFGSDGTHYFWVGRHKDAGRGSNHAGLIFDFITGTRDT